MDCFFVEETTALEPIWLNVRNLAVGHAPPGEGTPDKYYLVTRHKTPFLVVRTYYRPQPTFLAHKIWMGFFYIVMDDHVVCIDLQSLNIEKIPLDKGFYVGGFYPLGDRLLITTNGGIFCIDKAGTLVWKSPVFAIDGVIINDCAEGILYVSGELDPPGGWADFKIEMSSGKMLAGED